MDAILFNQETSMLEAAKQAAEKGFGLYMTRTGAVIAAPEKREGWMSVFVGEKRRIAA